MAEPSDMAEGSGTPAEGAKKPWAKIAAVVIVVVVVIAAIAAWRLSQPVSNPPPPPPPVNGAPVITTASADRDAADIGGVVSFTASATDPENDALTYKWLFGDGTSASGATATHSYDLSGRYVAIVAVSDANHTVTLVASNYLGVVDVAEYTVLVTASPPPSSFVKNPNVFTFVTFGEPDSLDPAYDYETSGGQIIQNVAEGLIWYQREKADVFSPMLATKVPALANPADVSPNGRTYNLTLKAGLTFTSGNPVDCAAVIVSIKLILVLNDVPGPAWFL